MHAFQRQFDQRKPRPSQTITALDRRLSRHPRRFINMQIVWIMSYLTILIIGILRLAKGWKADGARGLALGCFGILAGVVGIATGFYYVNWAMKRLQAKITSNVEPDEIERPSDSSLDTV